MGNSACNNIEVDERDHFSSRRRGSYVFQSSYGTWEVHDGPDTDSKSMAAQHVQTFMAGLANGGDTQELAEQLGKDIGEIVELSGLGSLLEDEPLVKLIESSKDKKVGGDAFVGLLEILKATDHTLEPVILPLWDLIIDSWADKNKSTALASESVAEEIVNTMRFWAVGLVTPKLVQKGLHTKAKPIQKELSLKMIKAMALREKRAIGRELDTLIPAVVDQMMDIKKEVKAQAREALEAILHCNGNSDLDPFIPVVMESILNPKTVGESVEKLASCVFVQSVEAPALSCVTPVLLRGLNDRAEETKRKCCVIIDNMCKLVEHPHEVLPLMPKLEPTLAKAAESISNPEARSVAEKAHKTLKKAGGEGSVALTVMKPSDSRALLAAAIEAQGKSLPDAPGFSITADYVAQLIAVLTNGSCFDATSWTDDVTLFLNKYFPNEVADKIMEDIRSKCENAQHGEEDDFVDDDELSKDLYKGQFSLAYGSLTLLNNTKLHLKRNKFYGLLGPNNCGKTTLMRAIANEQVEGFPKRDELRTIFVEHEIQEREVGEDEHRYPILNIDLCGIDWVVDTCNNVYNMNPPVNREQVIEVMVEIGFGHAKAGVGKNRAADAEMGVTTYSGGWKMKMQLCAATLMNADILMLDEPTGHLDVKNIAWIKEWLASFLTKGGSVICTSHDSAFLNDMCTHIVDFQDRKLKMFKGDKGNTLTQFVEKHPEKKSYFELKNETVKFVFPKPGPLDGVKSKTKAIMKMTDVTFQYPSRDTPTVFNICLQVSQVSRVAVIGPNGAGKSTAIKLLNGELKPNQGGVIWKHPNMRLAYVAQHAFQHLERHLTKTPVQYIMWRFAGNDDKENIEFKDEKEDEDELKAQSVKWFRDPKQSYRLRKVENKADENNAVVPETIMKRRDNKKEKIKEYEVKWMFKPIDQTSWEPRDILIKMGYLKMVQRQDEKEAAASGLQTKLLTGSGVEKHLADFGIDPEAASHTLVQSLSGGQKVKVVLAASMWLNPHLVILDEPTNYLDRDGLGALTHALHAYEGGVIIISHNREFANAVSQEKWVMEAGHLRREGESLAKDEEDVDQAAGPDEIRDASGNTIKITKAVQSSDKEKKQELKRIEKQLKDHAKKKYLSDDEYWELKDRQEELKADLVKEKK